MFDRFVEVAGGTMLWMILVRSGGAVCLFSLLVLFMVLFLSLCWTCAILAFLLELVINLTQN